MPKLKPTPEWCQVDGQDLTWAPYRRPLEYKHAPGLAKYLAEFETGRANPDQIKVRIRFRNGTEIDKPIRLTPTGQMKKSDRERFTK